jgi:hypothetical protein
MNAGVLEAAAKAAAFTALQDLFIADVPPEHQADVTKQHDKTAAAIAKAVAEVVAHITTFAQATGTVTTTVSTIVATAGSAVAQTGTGTGSGTGTSVIAPGGIT